jgi:hypothetical protein
MKKNLMALVFGLLLIVLLAELTLSNYYFRTRNPDKFSLISYAFETRILPLFFYKKMFDPQKMDLESNPFVMYPGGNQIQKLHPFIDYTMAFSDMYPDAVKLDYFGFRNDEDFYFDKTKNYKLVVLTGGSEAAGYTHKRNIAQNLEKILNQRSSEKFKVLNLAMNAYSLSNEINSYVNLAFHLKPEFVIAHSGANDITSGLSMPNKFKELGLNYHKWVEKRWLTRLYHTRESSIYIPQLQRDKSVVYDYVRNKGVPEFVVFESGLDILIERYWRNFKKFQTIVNSNQGKLIIGIQPINLDMERNSKFPIYFTAPNRDEVLKVWENLYADLCERALNANQLCFDKMGEFEFEDFVHTKDTGSLKIAEIYANKILGN